MTDTAFIGPTPAPDLHVMTFNIRRRIQKLSAASPDLWATRRPLVERLLQREQPSVLGVQEALPDQARAVGEALGSRYRMLGHGRSRTRTGEGCPLFFDTERLTLLDWRQSALSDKPDVPGSASWGNGIPRVIVTAHLADVETGAEFLAVNTHFDHLSRRSRIRSALAVDALVAERGLPALLTGDFNTGVWTKPYVALTDEGVFRDTWSAARWRLSPEWGTFPSYREPRHERKRIDWILATPDIAVEKVGINVTRDDGWPSDHAPVQAVVRIAEREAPLESNGTGEYLDAEHPEPDRSGSGRKGATQDGATRSGSAPSGPGA
jgi:endonuclease/exonuclease/phosphatase family metal-dependent hydrolase